MALIETRNARRPRKNDQRDANVRHLKWSQVQHGIRSVTSMSNSASSGDAHTYFGVKNTIPDYITLWNRDEIYESVLKSDPGVIVAEIINALETICNPYAQIKLFRNLLRRAGTQIVIQNDLIDKLLLENDRVTDGIGERGRKRWTQQDDELLIEMAAQEDVTIIDLSKQFGRTPGAIQSRISRLVGIKKLSAEIAGRFIGTLNGEFVEGNIDGIVRKN